MKKAKRSAGSEKLVSAIIESILAKKGEEVVSVDLTGIENAVCRYFVICHAASNTQVRAIAENVERNVRKKLKEHVWQREGTDNCQWVLLDYADVVVHVFQSPYREFYNLEGLWADAYIKRVDKPEKTE
ncbi:MAG: ribosome silencing factor [Bacteroidetes bacterium]|nr:ribosome silencing factor [Bacteroidota bacterium]